MLLKFTYLHLPQLYQGCNKLKLNFHFHPASCRYFFYLLMVYDTVVVLHVVVDVL